MRGKRPRSVWLASLRALREARINARARPAPLPQPTPRKPVASPARVQNSLAGDSLAPREAPVDIVALRAALAAAGVRNATIVAEALAEGNRP